MSPSLRRRLSNWFGRRGGRAKPLARPRAGFRPAFEHLEDRVIPAVRVWSGASALSANWSDNANWVGAVAPSAGDDLLFPGGGAQAAVSSNDFAANTRFNSITIDASGYTLTGNAVNLDAGGLTVNSATAGGVDTVGFGITLVKATSITDTYAGVTLQLGPVATGGFTLTVGGSSTINETGAITGTGGLVKSGSGTLRMQTPSAGTDNYTGATAINAGIVQVASGAALGTSSVTVASGATLQLLNGASFAQALTLSGSGVGGGLPGSTGGALEGTGTVTDGGSIALGADAVIGVDAGASLTLGNALTLNGHTLTVNSAGTATFNGALNDGTGAGNLVVNSALTTGKVVLRAADPFTGTTTVDGGTLSLSGAGTLVNTRAYAIAPGGTLAVDNSAGVNTNRISDTAPINLGGGTLQFVGGAVAAPETIGTLTLASGHSNVRITPGASTIVTAAGLIHDTGATVNFSSTGVLGSANDKLQFTAAPPTITTSGGSAVMLYATVNDGDFAVNTATGVATFAGYVNNLATAQPNDVVKLTANTTVAANKTVAGLVTNGKTITVNLGITLTLGGAPTGGGLLMTGGSAINPGGGGLATVKFGGEGFLFAEPAATTNTITTQITGTGGVDFSGAASASPTLLLNPGALGSAFSGGAFLDSANLSLQGTNPLGGAANTLVLVGGVLTSPTAAYKVNNPVGMMGGNTTLNGNNLTLTGVVTLGPSGVPGLSNVLTVSQPSAITGRITGTGPLVQVGTSSLLLSPALRSDFSGGTTLAGGTMILGSAAAPLGTGSLTVTGGATLQNSVAGGIILANPLVLNNVAPAAGANATFSGTVPFTFTGGVALNGQTVLKVNAPTTFSGTVGGSGGLTQSGTGTLTLTGNNTYTGATMVTGGGRLVVNGSQPGSAVGVVNGSLSGGGQLGFLTVGALGSDTAGPTGNGSGIQSAPGANFSEGGNLTVQVAGYLVPGTDFSGLNLEGGPLVLGGTAAAPSTVTLDLTNLSAAGQANGVALFGTALGTTSIFNRLRIVNNPNDFAADLSYPGGALNVIVTLGVDVDQTTTVPPIVPPTTKIWTGRGGGDPSWTNPSNWASLAKPNPGDDLVFPAGAAELVTSNDFPAGTTFNSITVEAGGYTLQGNAVVLLAGLSATEPPGPGTPTVTVGLPINITPGAGTQTTFTSTYAGTSLLLTGNITNTSTGTIPFFFIDGAGNTTITGTIGGTGGLTKNGPGTLDVFPAAASGSTNSGSAMLNAGLTVINNGNALGANNASGIAVSGGATLQAQATPGGVGLKIAESLSLAGYGVAGPIPGTTLGALSATTALTLSGGVNLTSGVNASIDNLSGATMTVQTTQLQLRGSTLDWNTNGLVTVTAQIVDGTGFSAGGSVVFNGTTNAGTFTLSADNTYSGHTIVQSGVVTVTGAGDLSGSSAIDLDTNGTTIPGALYLGEQAGVLKLVDTAGGKLSANAALNLQGGRLWIDGALNAATKETVGVINVVAGQSFLYMEAGTGTNASLTLNAGSLNHTPGATVDFSYSPPGKTLGSVANILHFTSPPTPDAGGIIPYATVSQQPLDVNGNPIAGIQPFANYASYDNAVNKTIFGVTSYSNNINGGGVVELNGPLQSVTITTPVTIDALLLHNGSTVTIAPGGSLTLTAGLLTAGNGAPAIVGGGPLSFTAEADVMAYSPTTIGAAISSANPLALAGNSTIHLSPAANNTYSGGTFIDSGTVSLDNNNQPLGTGTITFYGGNLDFAAALGSLVNFPNAVAFNSSTTNFVPFGGGALALDFTGPAAMSGYDPTRQVGLSTLAIASNLSMTFDGAITDVGGAGATPTGGFIVSGGGTLALTNSGNSYSAGTTLAGTGNGQPTLIVGDSNALGTGPLILGSGTFEANTPVTLANPIDLDSANAVLGGAAPNNGPLTFQGGTVTLTGSNLLTVMPNIPTVISDNLSGTGSLNSVGALTLSGPNSTQTGATSNTGGPLEIDGTQTASPVAVTGTTLDGTGDVGYLSVGSNGTVAPGTAANIGVLLSTGQSPLQGLPPPPGVGANFSNNGTLDLRIQGTTLPGILYDQLDLTNGTNPLVVGGTSRLVLDLAGLGGLTQTQTVAGVILYNQRIGNIPIFNEVDIIDNPNNYVVELDYLAPTFTNPGELDLKIALGSVDAPLLTVPVAQTTPEDLPLTFSAGNHNPISVSDVGAGLTTPATQLSVTLAVSHGTLSLGSPGAVGGLSGNGTATVKFTGTVAAVNLAIAGLKYTPGADYVGADVLTVSVTNPGGPQLLGTPQTTLASLNLTVTPTADAPIFTLAGSNLGATDVSGPITVNGWATNVQGEPPNQGNLAGLSFTTTDDNQTLFSVQPKVTLVGNTGTLTFTPQPNNGGIAHVKVTLSNGSPDLDGDTDSSSATFTITITNTNAPAVTGVFIHWGTQKASLSNLLNTVLPSGTTPLDLPFYGINAIDVSFNQNVGVAPGAFTITSALTGFNYLPAGVVPTIVGPNTLEWRLPVALAASTGYDTINLGLSGTGISLPSPLSTFKVLVGDVTGNGVVDLNDQLAVVRSLGIRYSGIAQFLDVDGDGSISMNDYNIVRRYTGNKNH